MLSPVRLPVVCLSVTSCTHAGGRNFRQYFYGLWYVGHPLTSKKKFTEIIAEEPLRRGTYEHNTVTRVVKYSDIGPIESYVSESRNGAR